MDIPNCNDAGVERGLPSDNPAGDTRSLHIERDNRVATLTLDRASARNGLTVALIGELTNAIRNCGAADDVGAIVIQANGPVFSAGHDLKEMTAHRADGDGGRGFYVDAMARCAAMMLAIVACPKPVIAAVEGTATAAGLQLVASCDLAIAGVDARFCTPGVNIGLFCSTPMVALSRTVAPKHAMEMLLLGDMVDASQALAWGLVNRVVETAEVRDVAHALAHRIASKSPVTLATGKRAFYAQAELQLAAAYDYTAGIMVENMLAFDAKEGIAAFLEKRAAKWSGS